jgi:hypothetical protein
MNGRHFLALLALVAPTVLAQPVSVAPWMTGERLIELAAWPAGAKDNHDLTPAQYLNQQIAKLYIHGVHDATEGKAWCYSAKYRPKPDVIEDAALDALRALTPEQRKRNAADLIEEAWRRRWPCPERSTP